MAVATETKARPLFTVRGDANGIKVTLSKSARDSIERAVIVLEALAQSDATFPKALELAVMLGRFLDNPAAKADQKTP